MQSRIQEQGLVVFLQRPKGEGEEPDLQSPACPQPAQVQGVSSTIRFLPPAPLRAQHRTWAKIPPVASPPGQDVCESPGHTGEVAALDAVPVGTPDPKAHSMIPACDLMLCIT